MEDKMSTSYSVDRLGAKYPGRCVGCGQQTGSRFFELADTILLRGADHKYRVAHPICVGIVTKGCVQGGRKIKSGPDTVNGNF